MSLSLQALTKRFGSRAAVDAITVDVDPGAFFAVLGPSGCGKSTLLRLIAGLERPDSGVIALAGETVSSPAVFTPPERRKVGFVFQSYALWPHMNVLDNVAFAAESAGQGRGAARQVAALVLKTVALDDLAERRPAALSGGQRQRVALARCLAGGARTILMDEPLANLDPHLREAMERELRRFHAEAGVTTVYITHDQREAMALADRIAVMRDGRFQQVGRPQDIHDRPATEAVARFIGRGAMLDATLRDGVADLGPLQAPARMAAGAPDGPARALARPGDVTLGETGAARGVVTAALYRGGTWEAELAVAGLSAPLAAASATPLRPGETLGVTLTGCWIIPDY